MFGFLALLVAVAFVLAVSYGGHLFWSWVESRQKDGKLDIDPNIGALALAAFIFASTGSVFAQSSTPTINFDLTPFFDSLNVYLPIFITLFGVIGGIAGAMALARYIIGAVVRAFSGGSI